MEEAEIIYMIYASQEEYAALQSKYQAIKTQRIQQLETLLEEQTSKVRLQARMLAFEFCHNASD